jgi:predicted nucleic acid-binding protein
MDASDIFVDTNADVYAFDGRSPLCLPARQRLLRLGQSGHRLWISGQIVREFCAAVSRLDRLTGPADPHQIATYAKALLADFQLAAESELALQLMLEMIEVHGVQGRKVFDLHLVATMRANGIRKLLTNNGADFKNYSSYVDIIELV